MTVHETINQETGKVRVTLECGPGRTKQEFKKETDINVILKKFEKTGIINFRDANEAMYEDIDPLDFHQAMNIVAQGKEMFEALPATLRKRFGHDPENFLEFIQDPGNKDEARKLGLLRPDTNHDLDGDGVPDIKDKAPEDPGAS